MEVRERLTLKDWIDAQPKIRAMEWCLDEKCPNSPWYGAKPMKIRIKLPEKGWIND